MDPAPGNNPYASPTSNIGNSQQKPGRGTLVLIFGILGIAVCFAFGIAAWVMGKADIREMDAGIMNNSERGITQAGYIIGMVAVIINVLVFGIILLAIIGGAASSM